MNDGYARARPVAAARPQSTCSNTPSASRPPSAPPCAHPRLQVIGIAGSIDAPSAHEGTRSRPQERRETVDAHGCPAFVRAPQVAHAPASHGHGCGSAESREEPEREHLGRRLREAACDVEDCAASSVRRCNWELGDDGPRKNTLETCRTSCRPRSSLSGPHMRTPIA